MAATKRLAKEFADVNGEEVKNVFRQVQTASGDNLFSWTGFICPDAVPYNTAAYKIHIEFPAEYPFKPPKLTFRTPIYHPNVDEKGSICLPIIDQAHWKPATKILQVVQALVNLINEPEPDHPLRSDLAEEYQRDKNKFIKNASEHAKKHGEPRPDL